MLRKILNAFLFLLAILSLITACTGSSAPQEEDTIAAETAEDPVDPNAYDAQLAEELGADEYGMKKYVMAFLKRGPNRDRSPDEAQALQRAHMDNIGRLAEAGKLILAGPFMDDGELRGIYIFDVETVEEARALTETDPAIQAGSLVMDLLPWYGSAALLKLKDYAPRITKTKI